MASLSGFGNVLKGVSNVLEIPKALGGGRNPFPDLKISEGLRAAGNLLAPAAHAGSIQGASTGPTATTQYSSPAGPARPTSGGSRTSTPQTTQNTQSFDPRAEADRLAGEERARKEEAERRIRAEIDSAYQPIFDELDRQVGLVPGQKLELEGQVGNLSKGQVADVEEGRASRIKDLEGNKTTEVERGKGALRNLEQNMRDALEARSFYFGSLGAGDSSAPLKASEAITRAGLRARGGILETRNQALSEIDGKIEGVKDTADTQLRKIDEWKSNKLFEVGQWAVDRINELNTEKATASGRKGEAIANLITQTETEFVNRLRQLDDAVFNYRSTVQQWQDQRAAELEDYKTKLSLSSAYSSQTSPKYTITTDDFGNRVAINPYNPNDFVVVPTGIALPGSTGSSDDEEEPVSLGQRFFGVGQ